MARSFNSGRGSSRRFNACLAAAFAVVGVLAVVSAPRAQDEVKARVIRGAAPAAVAGEPAVPAAKPVAEAEDAKLKKGDELAEKEFPNGASLKTDQELERMLIRAEQFVVDGRYDAASLLWQRVLDESGDTLMTRDGRMYTSLAAEVERTLGKLPPEGLRVYRISADGEANAILGTIKTGTDPEEALTKIVRRYFMSSIGDDAAYQLGCLALDRHDFVGASRMFQQILEQHPDPSMSRADVLLRQAVAAARIGDSSAATQSLAALEAATGDRPPRTTISAVETFVQNAKKNAGLVALGAAQWLMDYGNPSRTGRMKALPKSAAEADLAEMWMREFDVLLPQALNDPRLRGGAASRVFAGGGIAIAAPLIVRTGRVATNQVQSPPENRESLVRRWKELGMFPTAKLLFDTSEGSGRIYVKTATHLSCWDAAAISDQPIWESAWLNHYEGDGGTQMLRQMGYVGYNMPQVSGPRTDAEILHLADRLHQSMSISGDLIFNIEGRRVHKGGGLSDLDPALQIQKPFTYGQVPRRTRRNWLAAYEARTGKARWYRSADDGDKDAPNAKPAEDIGFLAAPTPYGNMLLVPVTDGGTVWLYALARDDGKTVWKTYLCDEPVSGANQWATVGVAVDGRDCYVGCGTGAAFALDAVSGAIRWAVRYQRTGKPSTRFTQIYGGQSNLLELDGFHDDMVIPYGKLLVILPSDRDHLMAIDRRTGELAWESPQTSPLDNRSVSYCVGVVGRNLYVAGRDVIKKYDILDGRLMAERVINEAPRQADSLSFGRGCVTEDAVYLPVKDSVLKLDLNTLADISQVGVSTVSGDPVGNIYSDGDKLWVVGASKVYALTNFDRRMADLARRIEAGDATAQLIRMRMQRTRGNMTEAIADLEGAYRRILATKDLTTAARTMLDGLRELNLSAVQPLTALRLLGDVFLDQSGRPVEFPAAQPEDQAVVKELIARRNELTYTALSTIRTKKTTGSAAAILRVAPYFNQDHLIHAGRKALAEGTAAADVELLSSTVAAGQANRVIIAVEALARLQGEAARATIMPLVANENQRVRLAAARGLLNTGDPAALGTLVELLDAADLFVAREASSGLRFATGQQIAFTTEATARKAMVQSWKDWLAKDGATAKLKFPLPDGEPYLGRTLIVSYGLGQATELDESGKEVWSTRIQGAWSGQGLPNGNRLFALYAQQRVVEYNNKGEEIWSLTGLPGNPYRARRLSNGNTLVACGDGQEIREYNEKKEVVWSMRCQGRPMDAVRLENGNLLVAMSNESRVVEYDTSGKEPREVWSCNGLTAVMTVQRLENGNTLVSCQNGGVGNRGQVVEVAPDKSIVWKVDSGLVNAYDAQRLPNGNTLIADNSSVREVEPDKKVIWQQSLQSASSIHRY